MKKAISVILLSVIICITSAALSGCLYMSYSQERQGPAMWIVEDKDGNRCYLFGTVHTAKNADMYPFADVIEDAYSYCKYIAVEYDVTAPEGSGDLKQFEYTDGTTVKDHLSSETYEAAVSAVRIYEGEYDGKYDKYVPAYWYSLIDSYNTINNGYSDEYGSDSYFINKAKNDGKDVFEIEGAAKQTEITLSLSDTVMDYFISQASKNRGSTGLDYYDAVYKEGSMDLLSYSVNSSKNAQYGSAALNVAMSEYYDIMFTQRNNALALAVKKCLADKDRVFFALSISRLVGEDGVVSVLQSSGYRVVRK
ncbi:MAG: TraB/GumN family protein [Clostridia bacterium]|nr:TraB/GumN family protein [Clostridia bacterium]